MLDGLSSPVIVVAFVEHLSAMFWRSCHNSTSIYQKWVTLEYNLQRHFHTHYIKLAPATKIFTFPSLAFSQRSTTRRIFFPWAISKCDPKIFQISLTAGQCNNRCVMFSGSTLHKGYAPLTPSITRAHLAFVVRVSFKHLHTKWRTLSCISFLDHGYLNIGGTGSSLFVRTL